MTGHGRRIEGLVAIALILGAGSAASVAVSQAFAGQTTQEMAFASTSAPASRTGDEVIAKMLERNRLRNEQLQRYSAVRTYEIKNAEGKLAAQAMVRVEYWAPDKKTFSNIFEKGSGIVRHLVFDRLIQSETETSSGQEHRNSAITSANYTFSLSGEEDVARIIALSSRPPRGARRSICSRGKYGSENMDRCRRFRGSENRRPPCQKAVLLD